MTSRIQLSFIAAVVQALTLLCLTIGTASSSNLPVQSATRDGSRDFNFLVGTWKLHNRRLRNPLSGSHEWYEFPGTSQARSIWGGRGLLEVVRFEMPTHVVDGLSIHFYDSKTGQWSQYWATAADGLSSIPNVGVFDAAGVGILIDHETFRGKPIMTRYRWSHGSNAAHWDQAFSNDGGKTWELNWSTDYTRT